ncbi:MAG: phosphoserine phosphatase SerB [Alphaproteobacteria bacterium]|nr:phosphoserine phosphatase SerB [Alphaproteobacteria bacterium]
MSHIVTLVAPREEAHIDSGVLAAVADAIAAAGGTPGAPHTLEPGEAADIPASGLDAAALRAAAEAGLAGARLDLVAQPLAHRRKRLLVADMDSTIINVECIDELADLAGIKAEIAAITERAMRGELAFEPALRERVARLAGQPEGIVAKVLAERVRLNPGARTLVRTMAAKGAVTALVSGGFTAFTRVVAERAGFAVHRANELLVEDGRLAGRVREPILGRDAKLATLKALASEHAIPLTETLAVGDGANDLAMIEAAGLGIAYRAKPVVAAAADGELRHADLAALLFVQGYRRNEFAAD